VGVPRDVESYAAAFERIEAAVQAGETDLRALGFWRLVAGVKAEQPLAIHWAETVGRIDRAGFERRVRGRAPVWLGNGLLLLGTLAGALAVTLAVSTSSEVLAGLGLLIAAGVWSGALHDPAHWLAGRLGGIRFTSYFVSWRPFPPRPGLKTDYATYLRASPVARAWMHASGALVTKLAPLLALAFWPATKAPAWAAWALLAFGAIQVLLDARFSVRSSDWKRVRRELRVARLQASRR
jgi:hypothetical protein